MRKFIALFIIVFAIYNSLYCQNVENLPFKSGEKLSYILNYTWGGIITDVGSATCVTTNKDGVYNVLLTGKSYRFFDLFFKVREHFETKFDSKTLRPISFYRSASEGRYRLKNNLTFNNETYTIKSRIQKYDRTPIDTLLKGTKETFDLVSLIFNYRAMDMSQLVVNKAVPFEFVIDNKIYHLYFIYKGKERKKISGMGTYSTLKFSAAVVSGNIFSGEEELYIWVSDDNNRIPLFFESPIRVGKVQGRISKIEGNKYPITSKIK